MAALVGRIETAPFVASGATRTVSADDTYSLVIVGKYTTLEAKRVAPGWTSADWSLIPKGYEIATATLERKGDAAEYRLALRATDASSSAGSLKETVPSSVTWRITMEQVSMPLVNHPAIEKAGAKADCVAFVATDPAVRFEKGSYYYGASKDDRTEIKNKAALRFCAAYTEGIETYVKYLPVVEKVSTYATLPGATSLGSRSYSGGNVAFSECGHFDTPPLVPSGYGDGNGNWFKSGDSWEQSDASYWTRTEQWTYTDDKSHSWIYDEAEEED